MEKIMKVKILILSIITLISLAKALAGEADSHYFIENKGQWPESVRYLAKLGGTNAWITRSGVVFDYYITKKVQEIIPDNHNLMSSQAFNKKIKGHVVKMNFNNENYTNGLTFEGIGKKDHYINYFIGNDPSKWAANVNLYNEAIIREIYPGISMRWYFDSISDSPVSQLRYDFIVQTGADITQIRLTFEGQDGLTINEDGEFIIKTQLGDIKQVKLLAYQVSPIPCSFYFDGRNTLSFNIQGYNPEIPLTIDPIIWSTFLGGSTEDTITSIKVDSAGNTYATGCTNSSNVPVSSGAYDNTLNNGGFDLFITKFNQSAKNILFSTYIGGSFEDKVYGLDIDAEGNSYITGSTISYDYPTKNSLYSSYHDSLPFDAFVTKLNSSGTALVYSTYLGGSNKDIGLGIAADPSGNAFVTGYTLSLNFPITSSTYDNSFNGGTVKGDAFVTKLNNTGSGLIYSTYIGAEGEEYATSIAVDALGQAFITGFTNSLSYPTAPAFVYDRTFNGGVGDAFVTVLNSLGNNLIYSSFLGGTQYDEGRSIAVDGSGSAYLTGATVSTNFEIYAGAYDSTFNGGTDIFISKFNPQGTYLNYSTYIGGVDNDIPNGIALDNINRAVITGYTSSTDYPITCDAGNLNNSRFTGFFITQLNQNGRKLDFSVNLGSSGEETGNSIDVDPSNDIYVGGFTNSPNFPVTNGYDSIVNGSTDGFIMKFRTSNEMTILTIDTLDLRKKHGYNICDSVVLDTFYIKSTGCCAVRLLHDSIEASSEYSLISPSFPVNIFSDSSLTVIVQFKKNLNAGEKRTKLRFINNTNTNPLLINLVADNGSSEIQAEKFRSFHPVCCAAGADTFYIHSTGSCPLIIYNFNITGADMNKYTRLAPVSVPDTIKPGDSLAVIMMLTPGDVPGFKNAGLSITNNTKNSPWNVSLSGYKVTSTFSVNNNESDTIVIDLGNVCAGSNADTIITIQNLLPQGAPFKIGKVDSHFEIKQIDKAYKQNDNTPIILKKDNNKQIKVVKRNKKESKSIIPKIDNSQK
jgi:hypothetical protein